MVYTPQRGAPRTIKAIVARFPPDPSEATCHCMRIEVMNGSVNGISSDEVIPGADTITVSYRPGTAARLYTLKLVSDPNQQHMDGALCCFDLY